MSKCCYCKKKITGEPNFCVPEDFPCDPRNGGRPLCDACGGGPLPTLEEICILLDYERHTLWQRVRRFSGVLVPLACVWLGFTYGGSGLLAATVLVVATTLVLRRLGPPLSMRRLLPRKSHSQEPRL